MIEVKSQKFMKLILVFLISFVVTACSANDGADKYSRSDCIVEVELTWSVDGVDKVKTINLLAGAIDDAESIGYRGPYPAGFTFQDGDSKLYIQYFSECESRTSNAERMLDIVAKELLNGKAKYIITLNRISPAVKTIMLEGDAWVD